MGSRWPLQINFRPSASQALQKAYKRGRLEKAPSGKYRLNPNWGGGSVSRIGLGFGTGADRALDLAPYDAPPADADAGRNVCSATSTAGEHEPVHARPARHARVHAGAG